MQEQKNNYPPSPYVIPTLNNNLKRTLLYTNSKIYNKMAAGEGRVEQQ